MSVWGEGIFLPLVTLGLASGAFPQDFVEDRKKMTPGGFDVAQAQALVPSMPDPEERSVWEL